MKKRERAGKLSLFFCPEMKTSDASIAGSRSKLADARFSRRPHFHNLREQVPPVYNAFLISWKASRLLDGVNSPFPFFGCRSFPGREKRASSFQHVTKTKLDIVRQFIFERVELSH